MKVLIDTSILFPALDKDHSIYKEALALIKSLEENHSIVVLNTHLVAELFNSLSRQPRLPIPVSKVKDILHRLSERYERVDLNMDDYLAAVDRCAQLGLRGAVIYDALHFQAAIKAEVDVIYTGNLRDFNRLITDEITFKVENPLPEDSSKSKE